MGGFIPLGGGAVEYLREKNMPEEGTSFVGSLVDVFYCGHETRVQVQEYEGALTWMAMVWSGERPSPEGQFINVGLWDAERYSFPYFDAELAKASCRHQFGEHHPRLGKEACRSFLLAGYPFIKGFLSMNAGALLTIEPQNFLGGGNGLRVYLHHRSWKDVEHTVTVHDAAMLAIDPASVWNDVFAQFFAKLWERAVMRAVKGEEDEREEE